MVHPFVYMSLSSYLSPPISAGFSGGTSSSHLERDVDVAQVVRRRPRISSVPVGVVGSRGAAAQSGGRLRDPDGITRRVAERAVARAQGLSLGLLEDLRAGCEHSLEGRVDVVEAEHEHRRDDFGEEFLQRVTVGLRAANVAHVGSAAEVAWRTSGCLPRWLCVLSGEGWCAGSHPRGTATPSWCRSLFGTARGSAFGTRRVRAWKETVLRHGGSHL